MAKFLMTELVDTADVVTARLGGALAAGNPNGLTDADVGKFVKLVAESRYDLAAVGNELEGRISSIETAPQDGITIGGVMNEGRFTVTFDGLQATPGTGVVAIGDYVVVGTPVVKGTSLGLTPARVCKATGAVTTLTFKWRVVSLGAAGTGAVGTTGVIEYIC